MKEALALAGFLAMAIAVDLIAFAALVVKSL
jgi:hypothetical protein